MLIKIKVHYIRNILNCLYSLLFNITDLCTSNNQSEDSFMCSTQETLFTNTDDSMNIDEVKLEPYKEYFSSPEIFFNQNKKNICQGKITDCQSTSSFLSSCDTSLEKCTQVLILVLKL